MATKIRTTQPYRIDWKGEADGNPAAINKQLGKTCQDIDYSFQIVFESLKAIITQLNTLNAASSSSSSSSTTAVRDVLQGLQLGIDGNDGDDAFFGLGAFGNTISPVSSALVSLTSGVTGILPQANGGTNADLHASSGILAANGSGNTNVRTLTAGSTNLVVTNGTGASGNPTVDVGSNIALLNANNHFTGTGNQIFDGNLEQATMQVFSWNSKSFNTVYQAASDGFLVGNVQISGPGNQRSGNIVSDSSNPPTTVRTVYDVRSSGAAVFVGGMGICCPVRKGDYYEAQDITTAGSFSGSLWWVPLGTAG